MCMLERARRYAYVRCIAHAWWDILRYFTFVLLRAVTVRACRRAHTCSCRVVGGLLENQLHVRWIIRLVRRDRRRERREREREGETRGSCDEPILKPGRPGCMQRLTRGDIAERRRLVHPYNEPRTSLAFMVSEKRGEISFVYQMSLLSFTIER